MGVKIIEKEDGLIIEGVIKFKGDVEVWSYKDYRIVMILVIVFIVCDLFIILKDYECVFKLYLEFWKDFKNVGGLFDEWNVGK